MTRAKIPGRPVAAMCVASLCALVVSGCTSAGQVPVGKTVDVRPAKTLHPAPGGEWKQLGGRDHAHFARCLPPACPVPTRKTLATPSNDGTEFATSGTSLEVPHDQGPRAENIETAIVHFEVGSARLDRQARDTLSQFEDIARQSRRIVVRGRTDSTGGDRINQALAQARAQAVARYLRSDRAINEHRVAIDARGRCCYAAGNDAEDGRQLNRRAEVAFHLTDEGTR